MYCSYRQSASKCGDMLEAFSMLVWRLLPLQRSAGDGLTNFINSLILKSDIGYDKLSF